MTDNLVVFFLVEASKTDIIMAINNFSIQFSVRSLVLFKLREKGEKERDKAESKLRMRCLCDLSSYRVSKSLALEFVRFVCELCFICPYGKIARAKP